MADYGNHGPLDPRKFSIYSLWRSFPSAATLVNIANAASAPAHPPTLPPITATSQRRFRAVAKGVGNARKKDRRLIIKNRHHNAKPSEGFGLTWPAWPTLTVLAIMAILKVNRWRFSMNVHLTPELEQLVQNKVESGRYNSASEVVREALRLMEQKDELRAIQLQELRNRIDKGLSEAERGQGADGETFAQGLMEDLDARESKRKSR